MTQVFKRPVLRRARSEDLRPPQSDDNEADAVKIQSIFRGYYVRTRLMLAQQAAKCVQAGFMFAFRGTEKVCFLKCTSPHTGRGTGNYQYTRTRSSYWIWRL